jgi:O-antigen/teichoic acid export membrane protein
MALPFAIIFLTALMRTSSVPIAGVYLAIGRPELHRLFTGIRACLVLVLMYPAIKLFGLSGAALAPLAAMLVSYVIQVNKIKALTGLPMQDFFQPLAVSIIISAVVLIPWMMTRNSDFSNLFITVAPGLAGCVFAYAGIALFYYNRRLHAAG